MHSPSRNGSQEKLVSKVAFLLIPLWLPFVYLILSKLEMKASVDGSGPLSELGIFVLWASPVIGAIPIIFARSISAFMKVVVVPAYCVLGLLTTGVIVWAVGCSWGAVGCH